MDNPIDKIKVSRPSLITGNNDDVLKPVVTNWLIKHQIPEGEFYGSVIGASGSGKTFLALDMALTIAAGLPYWHKECDKVKRGRVLYLTKEGESGIPARKAAWLQEHNLTNKDIDNWFFSLNTKIARETGTDIVLKKSVAGNDKTDFERLIEDIEQVCEKDKQDFSLIVLDTLNRFYDGDENKQEDMNNFVACSYELRNRFKCVVMIIHHTGKDDSSAKSGGRGSSVFKGSLDFQYWVKGGFPNSMEVVKVKSKDSRSGDGTEMYFNPISVPINAWGKDTDGEPYTSLVLELSAVPPKVDDQLKKDKSAIMKCINDWLLMVHRGVSGELYFNRMELKKPLIQSGYCDGVKKKTGEKFTDSDKNTKANNEINPDQKNKLLGRLCGKGVMHWDEPNDRMYLDGDTWNIPEDKIQDERRGDGAKEKGNIDDLMTDEERRVCEFLGDEEVIEISD